MPYGFLRFHALLVLGGFIFCIGQPILAFAQQCVQTSYSFSDTFDNQDHMDAATTARWGQGEVTLRPKSSVFDSTAKSLGQRVYVLAPGDFDKDGWVDMVALMLDPDCHLHFMRNQGVTGSPPVHAGFGLGGAAGSAGFNKWRIDAPPGCSTEAPVLLAGDFDNDKDQDILFLRAANESNAGTIAYAYLYENTGLSAGVPQFTRRDVLSTFTPSNVSWHWTSTVAQSIDWNKDGRTDIVIGSSTGNRNEILLFRAKTSGTIGFQPALTLIANAGMATPIATASSTASGNALCPPAVSRGINAVMAADFDRDNDFDIIVGSTSEKNLKYWKNDGNGAFSRTVDIPFAEGGISLGIVADVDGDGDQDLGIGRDGWNCNGIGGTLWLYTNDGKGVFSKRSVPLVNAGDDLDFGAALQMDNDPENRIDMIAADGNNAGTYFQSLSQNANIFALDGLAASSEVDQLNLNTDAIVSVKITGLSTSTATPPANTLTYYVSNDDGRNWELLLPAQLPPTSQPHNFNHFGSQLRWKSVLTSQSETLLLEEQHLAPASKDTPRLLNLSLTYDGVDRRRYSRSGLAYGTMKVGGETHELVYSAAFYFPGYQATLTAFDLTDLSKGSSVSTGLDRVDNAAGVEVLWDAGEKLALRAASSRVIYSAFAKTSDADDVINDRVAVSLSELGAPTTEPTLQTLMGISDAEESAVFSFIFGSRGDSSGWKLYHIDHSTPVWVGAPSGDATYLQNNYEVFKTTNANRAPTVYIGANDGMLHAFDALTGDERWAFVPHNLLGKLKMQRIFDATGAEKYSHLYFVDGPLVVQDVYDGTKWRTILMSGQGKGLGRFERNYYFALDVTDPLDPKPLWEFSDGADYRQVCSGQRCEEICDYVCTSPACSADCAQDDRLFIPNSGAITIEAEHANTNTSVRYPHLWGQGFAASASKSNYMRVSPDDGTNCSNNITTCGAHMTYHFRVTTNGRYYPHIRARSTSSSNDAVNWGVNGTLAGNVSIDPDNGQWQWVTGARVTLAPGEHVFDIWMREDGFEIDKIVLTTSSSPPSGTGPTETCQEICPDPICNLQCVEECVPAGAEWPECGVGAGLQCCGHTTGENLCIPVGQACGQDPDPILGETWSAPIMVRAQLGTERPWLGIFGSGYNNRNGQTNVGRTAYALNVVTGQLVGKWNMSDIATSATNPSTIDNTLPASPNAVDIDNDGDVDRIYMGDLEGRLWKIETSRQGVLGTNGLLDTTVWPSCVVFDAGQPTGAGNRSWAPIITKPGIAFIDSQNPNLYFGTGGDDRAPNDVMYRFYSVRDTDAAGTCRAQPLRMSDLSLTEYEWVVGDGRQNKPDPLTADVLSAPGTQEGVVGERYWSDPLIINNSSVYFASLPGSIEMVNPCLSLNGASRFFGYAARRYTTATGMVVNPGETLFGSAWLASSSKIRQAPIMRAAANNTTPWVRDDTKTVTPMVDILVQEFSDSQGERPAIRRLTDMGRVIPSSVRVIRWHEVPYD